MATNAPLTGFSKRLILAYKQRVELLAQTVTTDGVAEGSTYKFLVGDTGAEEATTRGANGRVVYQDISTTQPSVTMTEYIAAHRLTGFNIFSQQGDSERIMHDAVIGKIARKKDQVIIGALNSGTLTTGAAAKAQFIQIQKGQTTLQNAGVPMDGMVTLLVTPAYLSYMQQWTEFNNSDLVNTMPLTDGKPMFANQVQMYHWNGMNVIAHPNLPGVGTASETCFMYHQSAVGLGFATSEEQVKAGFNDEELWSYCNMTTYVGATLLQNSGIVKIIHDGSEFQL